MIRENFFVFTAQRVEVCAKSSIRGAKWFEDNFDSIERLLNANGYDINAACDMVPLFDENRVAFFFIDTENQIPVGNKEFRGYLMNIGDSIVPSHDIIESINSKDKYCHSNFDETSLFKIEDIVHDDTTNIINYYLRCYVEVVEPVELHM